MRERGNVTWQVILGIGAVVTLGATLISAYNWMEKRYLKVEDRNQPEPPIVESLLPIGTIVAYFGKVEPDGWLFCNGESIPSEYQDLAKFLNSDRRPDLRGRTVVGYSSNDIQAAYTWNGIPQKITMNTFGQSIGEEKHKLTIEEMPNHNHENGAYSQLTKIDGKNTITGSDDGQTPNLETSLPILSQGGNKPHNNMQPSLVVNFIIKAK